MMSLETIKYIAVFVYLLLALFVIFGLYFCWQRKAQKKVVAEMSSRYGALLNVIDAVSKDITPVSKVQTLRAAQYSLAAFRSFKGVDFLENYAVNSASQVSWLLRVSEQNKAAYMRIQDVLQQVYDLESDWQKACQCKKMELSTFRKFEDELCGSVVPTVIFDLTWHVCVSYTSPAGRNRYVNEFDVSEDDMRRIFNRVTSKQAFEKARESAAAEFKRKQRSAMTNSLRYRILQRDNFRCVLCGRSVQDGAVKLEVDHILPVSKGGLTVESNLRTLCYDCNRGKSDRYVEGGVN